MVNDKKNILVTGANGQLGNEMQVMARIHTAYHFIFETKEALPIDDLAAVDRYFDQHPIAYCVNCAAYTAVDKAESATETAMLINGTAVGNLALVCKNYGTQLIHISTDYVFDGTATQPYKEDDPVSPVNFYGASKLKGEELALQVNPKTIILRTSWVYSRFGNNFVKTMLRLMAERASINVVSDQVGSPTFAHDLAAAIMKIIIQLHQPSKSLTDTLRQSPVFNYSNTGVINWYEFAVAIKELSGSNCQVNPIPAAQYPTPAKRPGYSVMDTAKIQQAFDIVIPGWKDSLRQCIALLKN